MQLFGDVVSVFIDNMVLGIKVNEICIDKLMKELLMLVIVLVLIIGYDNVIIVVKIVYKNGMILCEEVINFGFVDEEIFDCVVCLEQMIGLKD